jgi:hypothetical protein
LQQKEKKPLRMESMRLHACWYSTHPGGVLGGESVTAGDNLLRHTRCMAGYNFVKRSNHASVAVLTVIAHGNDPERRTSMAKTSSSSGRRASVPAEEEIRFWMRAPAVTVNLAAPVSEALALMREHNIRRLPVVIDTGELRGIITQGDIRGADLLRVATAGGSSVGNCRMEPLSGIRFR